MTTTKTIDMIAVFPLVKYAAAFATRIGEPGWWAHDIVRKGRTVVFAVTFTPSEHTDARVVFGDFLDTVGSFGSTQSRKATLNGVPAPFVW